MKKLVGKVVLTEEEVKIAVENLCKEDSNFKNLSFENKTDKVSEYWLKNGKKDFSFLYLISD